MINVIESRASEILALYEQGKFPTQIATELNLNPVSVNSFFQKRKIKFIVPGNLNYFEKIDTPAKAYILGFISADGCIQHLNNNKTRGLSIQINANDIEVLQFIQKETETSPHRIKHLKSRGFNMVRFTWGYSKIYDDLYNLGLRPRKSWDNEYNPLANVPYEFRDAFIIGYFDGDGSVVYGKSKNVSKTTGEIKVYQLHSPAISIRGGKTLLEAINQHLGINATIKFHTTYVLRFHNASKARKFFSLYKNTPFFLKRKYNKFLSDSTFANSVQHLTISSPSA